MSGWIALHRKIRDNWVWERPDYFYAFVDMLMMANHTEKTRYFKEELITVKRGQFPTSQRSLMKRWGWSRSKLRHFLTTMITTRIATIVTTQGYSLVTICKYDTYQTKQFAEKPTQRPTESTTDSLHYKNVNNDNNVSQYMGIFKIIHKRFGLQDSQYNGYKLPIIEMLKRIPYDKAISCVNSFMGDRDAKITTLQNFCKWEIDKYQSQIFQETEKLRPKEETLICSVCKKEKQGVYGKTMCCNEYLTEEL